MSDNIYIPQGAVRLNDPDYKLQLRLGIEGEPKTGKSHAALTFPNPISLSFDRGLISHVGRSDVVEVPFYDAAFIDKICPRDKLANGSIATYTDLRTNITRILPPNRKDALLKWLSTEALKLTKNQTLIVDGSTGLQSAFHMQYWTSPTITKGSGRGGGGGGDIDFRAEWKLKLDYFTEVITALKALACDVIYICHESRDRDDKGNLNGKFRPLMSGQFQDELKSHFTDWFRAVTIEKPQDDSRRDDMMKHFNIDLQTAKQWIESTPVFVKTIYLWQTQSDSVVDCGTSLVGAPKYVIANAATFKQYMRKNETS